MTNGDDTQTVQVVGDIEDAADDGISWCAVVETTSAHLNPTGAQAQLFCLVLHGDGGNGTVLHPTVVLHGIAQHNDGHGGTLKELRAEVLGIGEFLEVEFVVDHHKLPGALALGSG